MKSCWFKHSEGRSEDHKRGVNDRAMTVATIFLSAVFSDIVSAAHVRRDIEDRHAVDMTDSLVARMHAGLMDLW